MKNFFAIVALALLFMGLPQRAFALPDPTDAQFRLNKGLVYGPGVQLGYSVYANKMQTLLCQYDVAVQGGSTATALNLKAVDGSNCRIPNKAILIGGLIDVLTTPVAQSHGTISIGSGNYTNDLFVATTLSYITGVLPLLQNGTVAVSPGVTVARKVTNGPLYPILTPIVRFPQNALGLLTTTGKFNVYINYLMGY